MDKISPSYRNDSEEGLETGMRDYLDEEFFEKLPYVHDNNPKLLVVFAGGNAVGKSTLSEKMSYELHGLRLENDGVKRAILQKYPKLAMTDMLHQMTWQYTMDLYKRLEALSTNGLIIRDGVITWYFDRILPIFQERGYDLFIVGYNLSDAKTRELIKNRGDTATSTEQRFYELMEDQRIHLKRFFEHYTADIMLNDETVFDHDMVVEAVRRRLQEL